MRLLLIFLNFCFEILLKILQKFDTSHFEKVNDIAVKAVSLVPLYTADMTYFSVSALHFSIIKKVLEILHHVVKA